ncbi:MAG: hypothetical protein JNK87_23240, partial [Bryobacterales bacterium]|nr:hypothetical protein [Bryobacterales bacterium]
MIRAVAFLLTGSALLGQSPDAAFFESTIQPILRTNCLACHSEKAMNSGLSLETRESLLKGGNRGAGTHIVLDAIKQSGSLKMPPGRKLK